MYIYFALLYALFKGFNDIFKKKSRLNSHTSAVLAMMTTISFALCLIWIPFGIEIPYKFVPILAIKGFMLAINWHIVIRILKDANLSLVTTFNLLSVAITFTLGITMFGESVSVLQIVGIVMVLSGIMLMSMLNKKGGVKWTHFIFLTIGAIITAASSAIDKYTTQQLTNYQVQFWFYFYACLSSWLIYLVDCIRQKDSLLKKTDLKNIWIYLVGLFLFLGDTMLFFAYKMPNSQMIIITVLSKLKVLITVGAGILLFKEKNIAKKIMLTIIIILGTILIAVF